MESSSDHFLVINKIENGKVILTDSGKGDFMKEYDIEKFKESWNDSNNFMLISPKTGTYHQDENIANKWCEIKEGEIIKGKCSIIPVGKFSLYNLLSLKIDIRLYCQL